MKKWIAYINVVELVQVKEPKCFFMGIFYIKLRILCFSSEGSYKKGLYTLV